jgi:hypothetical protein
MITKMVEKYEKGVSEGVAYEKAVDKKDDEVEDAAATPIAS